MQEMLSDGFADFIDDAQLTALLARGPADAAEVRDLCAQALAKQPLTPVQAARLVTVTDPELRAQVLADARRLKDAIYGNRIVLFAPLYVGNRCVNDCAYCGFKRSNTAAVRCTLDEAALRAQITALEQAGHKRLILVFGEHPDYSPQFIADAARTAYAVKTGPGEIRRVNINAAPLDVAGYRTVKAAGIGTYQIFQETYHHATYARVHPTGRKADYAWRLDGLTRAMQGGCDDVGLGALFGLYDWRFEVLGLVSHAVQLQRQGGVGPHTISFPRLQPAHGVQHHTQWLVSDDDFIYLIAVLRLAVPYTELICTARENPRVRRTALTVGVSQIDAGTNLEIGGYTDGDEPEQLAREQFALGDSRSLDAVIGELARDGYLPSFCTSCYRRGRTGEHFMEQAIPGFIKRYCTPNALLTFQEYLSDYASPAVRAAGEALIARETAALPPAARNEVEQRLAGIRAGTLRDSSY
ncbi:MAG TPA: [FeFe] hydrogenase H-cluster radical SAM maturase HydG [bacterium]|nr:[FeFe] hydrogenase H-cluster radical SAM maturase HydG [bacterium]